jgi:predicted MFS family arabinose efflux permease
MSLTVALGQVGFAVGGALAGPLYAARGYASNALVGAVSVLCMGLIVWFFLPEPARAAPTAAAGAGTAHASPPAGD